MNTVSYDLKVNTVKRTEKAGKPDTFTVSLDGSTPDDVDFNLTVSAEDINKLRRIIPTVPGARVDMALAEIRYGNIESYGPAAELLTDTGFSSAGVEEVLKKGNLPGYDPADIEKTYMDPQEAREIIEGLAAIQPEPEEPPTMQADPYEAPGEASQDPREESQPEALEARRRAWQEAQAGSQEAGQ